MALDVHKIVKFDLLKMDDDGQMIVISSYGSLVEADRNLKDISTSDVTSVYSVSPRILV